jgi:DNA repair photolyase
MILVKGPIYIGDFPLPVYLYTLSAGITATLEFAKKRLAEFGVNTGLACGHCCAYGFCRAMFRCHQAFPQLGLKPFNTGYAIVDPQAAIRVQRDARRKRRRGMVILGPASDAWSPEAQHFGLGRSCAEAILSEPGWTLRVLTKNIAVQKDFDLFLRHRDRVLVGLSTTFLTSDTKAGQVIEPYASSPQERLDVLTEAHRRGLRTYGMLCPLIAPFYRTQEKVDEAFKAILPAEPEEIFAEVINPRGKGLIMTATALRAAGLMADADAIDGLRSQATWSAEAARVIEMVVDAARRFYDLERLRILVYPSRLAERDEQLLRRIPKGLIWLR